jgi:hypothetical protein
VHFADGWNAFLLELIHIGLNTARSKNTLIVFELQGNACVFPGSTISCVGAPSRGKTTATVGMAASSVRFVSRDSAAAREWMPE